MNGYARLRERFFDATRADDDHGEPSQRGFSDPRNTRQWSAACPVARHWMPGIDLYAPRDRAA